MSTLQRARCRAWLVLQGKLTSYSRPWTSVARGMLLRQPPSSTGAVTQQTQQTGPTTYRAVMRAGQSTVWPLTGRLPATVPAQPSPARTARSRSRCPAHKELIKIPWRWLRLAYWLPPHSCCCCWLLLHGTAPTAGVWREPICQPQPSPRYLRRLLVRPASRPRPRSSGRRRLCRHSCR